MLLALSTSSCRADLGLLVGREGTRQRGQAVGLQGRASARAGAHVAFKDSNGDVLRGVILTMSLYVPSQGKCLAVACGGQTVLFAYVFVAIRMSWAMVVTNASPESNPVPVVPTHPFPAACGTDAVRVLAHRGRGVSTGRRGGRRGRSVREAGPLCRARQSQPNFVQPDVLAAHRCSNRCHQTVRELWDVQGGCRSCGGSSSWEVASLCPTPLKNYKAC